MEYSYPISHEWSIEEIVDVIEFFEGVELAYEKGIEREIMIVKYKRFKEIVPSKSEEKSLFKEFEEVSGYESYPVVVRALEAEEGQTIQLEKRKKKFQK